MPTKLSDIINPQVMGDMISAKIPAMLKYTQFAKVDRTLEGVAGDTKTVPSWNFVGSATDFNPELGVDMTIDKLTASTTTFGVKCAGKVIGIYQTAINSGLGDPVGQAETQLAKAVAVKVDNDVLTTALTSNQTFNGSTKVISYAQVVDAVDVFGEEELTDKVMFIAPAQVTTLRKDADFLSADKYTSGVMMSGEIGMIAGVRVVPSKKIVKESDGTYKCPIIKLEPASTETEFAESELPALTIFMKKEAQLDHEWLPKAQRHDLTIAQYYGVALTNESKVVVATFKA